MSSLSSSFCAHPDACPAPVLDESAVSAAAGSVFIKAIGHEAKWLLPNDCS